MTYNTKKSKQNLSAHKAMHPCKLFLTLTLAMHINVFKQLILMTTGTEDLHFFSMLLSMQRTGDIISDMNFNFNRLYINKVYTTQLNNTSNCETVLSFPQNEKKFFFFFFSFCPQCHICDCVCKQVGCVLLIRVLLIISKKEL